jgi:ligand-binding sensor domain-containing protein
MIFNEDGNKRRFLTTNQGNGGLPDIVINCFAKDKNGEIWIGTNQGVAVFQNPSLAFDANQDVILPIFDGFPLLKDEVVTAIKIDGANRKWFGTNNGVWLLDRSAREILHNFTEDNSPLPSNNITGIEIIPSTGEVFFGTDKGIISFRGTATEAEATHGKVKVFPNPVKAGFSGTIGITGLANSASVKITDIYGNLISEGEAQGGMYTWNGRNYNGEGARPGVYLVFSSTSDGEDTNVAKILVIQ